MFYLLPLSIGAFLILVWGSGSSSPLLFCFWFSGFTALLTYFFLIEDCTLSGITLYLIEESLIIGILWTWFILNGSILLFFILLMKGALAPFHNWFIEVLSESSSNLFVWGLTFHKLPLLFLLSALLCFWETLLLLSSFLSGVLFIINLGSLRSVLILSSSNTLALILLLLGSSNSGFIFLFCYINILWSAWALSPHSIDSILLLLGAGGVPPFLFFQLNWEVFTHISSSLLSILFLAVASGATSIVYARFLLSLDLRNFSWGIFSFLTFWIIISILLPAS